LRARFTTHVQTAPGAYSASYTVGTCSLPGVKRPGRGVDNQLLSSADVKERVELYFHFPLWAFVTCSRVNFIFISIFI